MVGEQLLSQVTHGGELAVKQCYLFPAQSHFMNQSAYYPSYLERNSVGFCYLGFPDRDSNPMSLGPLEWGKASHPEILFA